MVTSVKINDELKDRIQNLAQIRQRSAHWIMREAINNYVDREEAKEKFKQEALNSWEKYKETGQHLTGQEISDWLESWGTSKESKVPQCHD